MDDHSVVQVWREINGVTDDGDFAFFFSSLEEAQKEVGDLIAKARCPNGEHRCAHKLKSGRICGDPYHTGSRCNNKGKL